MKLSIQNPYCKDHKCFRKADQECKQLTCGREYRVPKNPSLESQLTAAQAEIARLRSLHDTELNRAKKVESEYALLSIQYVQLQSALDVAVEGLEKIGSGEIRYYEQWKDDVKIPDQFEFIDYTLGNIKQIREKK